MFLLFFYKNQNSLAISHGKNLQYLKIEKIFVEKIYYVSIYTILNILYNNVLFILKI